ncbi:hypothetical protein JCM19992_29990 [Thermostilla marina]
MAKIDAAWGIDIGNAALKAIRLRPGNMPGQVVADAFDFIEYPMLLSQPGAERETLVETALQQFLSRNDVRGTRVAVAVPGQAGLARFIKLPPVEAKKIPNIVLFEAKQQIPYDLDSVVWRFQRMDADVGESQFAIEPEIGLFALKKDQVIAALEPLQAVGVEVDIIQLTPLALYNFIRFDKLRDLPPPDEYDPDNPPPSTVIVSVGTESTDLVVTNGFRVWQRNISVGGTSFTKALSKELKLTFSKAEHLKKNINTAPDPKQAFQAMRPVFNELLAQIQHSIGYYTTIDRAAKIESAIAVGSTFQLPGLRKFIEQGLGVPVELAEDFETLEGPEVTASPVFQEHRLSFGVSFGLALQGIDLAAMKINMLPDEIVRERAIRAKKPWRLAGAATVLTGLALSFALRSMALSQVSPKVFGSAEQAAQAVIERANNYKSQLTTVEGEFDRIDTLGKNVTENVEGRLLWLELLAAVNRCLPSDPPGQEPEDISQREVIFVDSIQSQKVADLATWWQLAKKWYQPMAAATPAVGAPVDPATADPNAVAPPVSPAGVPSAPTPPPAGVGATGTTGTSTEEEIPGPEGEGYLIQITAHHFHNAPTERERFGAEFVRQTLIKNLETASIQFGNEVVTMKELGISHPCLINPGRVEEIMVPDPNAPPPKPATVPGVPGAGPTSVPPAAAAGEEESGEEGATGEPTNLITLRRFRFIVQFAWIPKTPRERAEARRAAAEAAAAAAAAMPAAPPVGQPGIPPGAPTAPGAGAPAGTPGGAPPAGVPATQPQPAAGGNVPGGPAVPGAGPAAPATGPQPVPGGNLPGGPAAPGTLPPTGAGGGAAAPPGSGTGPAAPGTVPGPATGAPTPPAGGGPAAPVTPPGGPVPPTGT